MTGIDVDTTIVADDSHVATEIDGQTVVLNDNTGTYQGLDGVGPRIWELLQEPVTVGEVVTRIAEEYDVSRERCRTDVHRFVEQLADEELIEVDA